MNRDSPYRQDGLTAGGTATSAGTRHSALASGAPFSIIHQTNIVITGWHLSQAKVGAAPPFLIFIVATVAATVA